MATYRKILKEKKKRAKHPLYKANHVVKKMHMQCTYCHKQGHLAERCWTLNLVMRPQKLKEKVEREDGRNGKEDSMNVVSQDDPHVDADV